MSTDIAQAVAAIIGHQGSAETAETAETAAQPDGSWDEPLWRRLTDGGYTGIGIAEEHGGSGGDFADAAAAIKVTAARAARVPLAEHLAVGGWLSLACGYPVGAGPVTAAAGAAPAAATYAGDGSALVETGLFPRVPWARQCRMVLVPLRGPDGADRFGLVDLVDLADRQAVTVERGASLAGEPRDEVRLHSVVIPAARLLTPRDGGAEELRLRLAAARAVQLAGAIEEVLALTVRYAGERRQFGRPIGHFQAVQQSVAVLAGESAAASCGADSAVAVLVRAGAAGVPSPAGALAVDAATLRAGAAATRACRIAHQVHGALGFTDEHPLHRLTLRLWSWRDEPEPVSVLSARLGQRLADLGPAGLWPAMTGAL
jgi:acyl-CoA dehydrogenase